MPRSRKTNFVADDCVDKGLLSINGGSVWAVVLNSTLSQPADDFVAVFEGLGKTAPRIARYERQLAKIGARIANGCPRVGDEDMISRLDRKLDKLGNELSRWDAAITRQARIWRTERAGHHAFGPRAQISRRSPSRRSCRRAGRSHSRSRTPRRRRRSASRARASGDADGEPPGRRSPSTAIGGASW